MAAHDDHGCQETRVVRTYLVFHIPTAVEHEHPKAIVLAAAPRGQHHSMRRHGSVHLAPKLMVFFNGVFSVVLVVVLLENWFTDVLVPLL